MNKRVKVFGILFVLFLLVLVSSEANAQVSKQNDNTPQLSETRDSCEDSTVKINSVKTYFMREKKDAKDSIVVVAYSSEGEDAERISKTRLELAQDGLMKSGVGKEYIILTKAIDSSSMPRLDFYVSGRIVARITTSPNRLFCIECCSR